MASRSRYSSGAVRRSRLMTFPTAQLGLTGTTTGIPSVDFDLDRCSALAGQARRRCYERLDRKLTTQIVPWVPYLQANVAHITGPHVTQWQFDQFAGELPLHVYRDRDDQRTDRLIAWWPL